MQYKTTLVSMFFDLTSLSDSVAKTRPLEFYIESMHQVLNLSYPMVLFCDKTTRPLLEEARPKSLPTIYIEKALNEYDFYIHNHSIVTKNREFVSGYKNHRNTPSYYLLTMFKVLAMHIANERNDFNTSHLAWIDLGYGHLNPKNFVENATAILDNPRPKLSTCYIKYRTKKELNNMVNYVFQGPCAMAAGFFTIQKEYVIKFYSAMTAIFYEMLAKGLGHSEETCLIYCYDRFPDLFNIYYGDYQSLLSNYFCVTETFHNIRYFFLEGAYYHAEYSLCKDVMSKIEEGLSSGKLTSLSEEEMKYIKFMREKLAKV